MEDLGLEGVVCSQLGAAYDECLHDLTRALDYQRVAVSILGAHGGGGGEDEAVALVGVCVCVCVVCVCVCVCVCGVCVRVVCVCVVCVCVLCLCIRGSLVGWWVVCVLCVCVVYMYIYFLIAPIYIYDAYICI